MPTRTLVCIPSETRASAISWPSFKTQVLDALDADLAICIGMPDGYDTDNALWQNAKYRFTSREYKDWGEAFDLVQARMLGADKPLPDWRALLAIPGNWLGGIGHGTARREGSAAISMYFRWLLLTNLRDAGLLSAYDRFVVTRSDFIWESPHPPVGLLDERHIWIPDGEHYGGIMDRHAVLSRDTIETYLTIVEPILTSPQRLMEEMRHKPEWNYESYHRLQLTRGNPDRLRFFPYVMYAARDLGTTTSWSEGVWNETLGYAIKYPTEHMLALRNKPFFSNADDWARYFRPGQHDLLLGRTLATRDGEVACLSNNALAVKAFEAVVPKRHVLKVDVAKERLSPFFVDPEVEFRTLFPQFSELSVANWRGPDAIEIRVAADRFLSVGPDKTLVAAPEPSIFRLI